MELSDEELSFIEQYAELRHFDKRMKLIGIGDPEQYLNFVVKGVLKKYFYRNHDQEIITQIAKEGDLICSSVAFLSGSLSEYAIETLEPVSLISFSRGNIELIYRKSYRTERLGRLIIMDWFLQKEDWEHSRIRLSPKQRFLSLITGNPDLLMRVPQKSLASYLNIKPETFSRYKHLLLQRARPGQMPSDKNVVHHS